MKKVTFWLMISTFLASPAIASKGESETLFVNNGEVNTGVGIQMGETQTPSGRARFCARLNKWLPTESERSMTESIGHSSAVGAQ